MIKFDFKTFNKVANDNNYKDVIHKIRKRIDKENSFLCVDNCITAKELEKIKKVSNYIRNNTDILVVIGNCSAYLHSKAIIDAFKYTYIASDTEIIYVGSTLSSENLRETLEYIQDKNIALNVISSSGNTIETNLLFDVFYDLMEAKYDSKELKKRIIITTNSKDGRLRKLVKENGFVSFPVKKSINERYSMLTTIGLLPMCVYGIDIDKLIEGYKNGQKYQDKAYVYVVLRDIMYHMNKKVEVITAYEPKLSSFVKWVQMIFATSQGKKGKGVLPIKAINTDYIHILGNYLECGDNMCFQTVFAVAFNNEININDKPLSKINHLSMMSLASSSMKNAPTNIITLKKINEKTMGEVIYFIYLSSIIGCYLTNVDSKDETGLNKYKKTLIEGISEL